MIQKRKSRSRCGSPDSGREKQHSKTLCFIVRQSGQPVNNCFSCGFIHEVFDLLEEPITVDEIARRTCSPVDRVRLALHELRAAGVVIT